MSTRSNIAIKRKDGKVESIYCHWDGYLSYNGKILLEYYTELDKINQLIELGDISSLNKNVVPNGKNDNSVVVAYKRDRNETEVDKKIWNNIEEYFNNLDTIFIEYVYVYNEEESKWYYAETYRGNTLHLLTQQAIEEELNA